jgi:hypothetical protein
MSARRLCPLALLSLLAAALPAGAGVVAEPTHHCFPDTIRCGETRTAALDATECFVDEQSYGDLFTFTGPAGQDVTIRITSGNFTPKILLFDPTSNLVTSQNAAGSELVLHQTLTGGGLWRFQATSVETKATGLYTISLECSIPAQPSSPYLTTDQIPGYRFKVRITGNSTVIGAREIHCIPETLCVSGAVPGRTEVFLRVVAPRPNGYEWPTLVKFTTSQVEVWVQQIKTGIVRYYLLPGAGPSSSDLPGLFDRFGFRP